jgi:hypothetical protein
MRQRQATAFKMLPSNQTHALELIAAGARTSDVASTLGVHRTTVWKWTQEPEFQAAVELIREEAWGILSEGLRNQAAKAVFVLGEQLDSPDPRIRRDAARIVLGSYARLRPAEVPEQARVAEPTMTQEEAEERVLTAWRHIEEAEARRPGFIESDPHFINARAMVLRILARRKTVGGTP